MEDKAEGERSVTSFSQDQRLCPFAPREKKERDSHLEYLGTKCKYSRRMMMVRFILVETTLPVRMRPRIETRPVNGHFLSM